MATQLLSAAVAKRTSSTALLEALGEDVLDEIVRSAQTAGVLAPLASSSKQLCSSARSRTEYSLHVKDKAQAQLLLKSQRSGRPLFSGCTQLHVEAADAPSCFLASGVLGVAQQWPALQQLQVSMEGFMKQLQPGPYMDMITSPVLSGLRGLQHLRSLDLCVLSFNSSSAGHVGQLKQLTALTVAVMDAAADAPADMMALAGLSNLQKLTLRWPPAVQPAAAEGPYCLPSSLTKFDINQRVVDHSKGPPSAAPVACWLTHICGCPRLQELWLQYADMQHASAHPSAVVRLLAQHTPQLRSLDIVNEVRRWDTPVVGLPHAAQPSERDWFPDAALASLKQLQYLAGTRDVGMCTQEHWQHVMQLSALTSLYSFFFCVAPQQGAGTMLALLELEDTSVSLGGHELGLLLLACPVLERAACEMFLPLALDLESPEGPLPQHPTLQKLRLSYDFIDWDGCAAHFAGVAGVLRGVVRLELSGWQFSSSTQPAAGLPDLAALTALTSFTFRVLSSSMQDTLQQEDVLLMLAPLVELQYVSISCVPCVSARVMGWLQGFMPHLQHVELRGCGRLVPAAAGGLGAEQQQQQQAEAQALAKVRQLLRPGLVLEVFD